MIDLQDGGLYPISDFILEENFKQRYNDTHMDFQYQESLEEPYIEIIKMYIRKSNSGEKLYDIVPVLNTRQGDKLIFSNPDAASQSDEELKANSIPATFLTKSSKMPTLIFGTYIIQHLCIALHTMMMTIFLMHMEY